jgi:hypothetical protein
MIPNTRASILDYQAGGRGFEPRHTDPESAVLPLDEPPSKFRTHGVATTLLYSVLYYLPNRLVRISPVHASVMNTNP